MIIYANPGQSTLDAVKMMEWMEQYCTAEQRQSTCVYGVAGFLYLIIYAASNCALLGLRMPLKGSSVSSLW